MANHYAGLPDTVPATRPYDLARHLVTLGHQVTIFACSFNHYTFKEERVSGARLFRREVSEGVEIIWIRSLPYQKNGLRRLANMLGYAALFTINGAIRRPRPDVVIGTTVHPFAPLAAFVVARLRGARFWLDITDIWPDSLIELGHLPARSFAARLFGWCENFSLRRADTVMSVLPNVTDFVRAKGLQTPTLWTPNGFDRSRARVSDAPLRGAANSVFTVTYAGGFAPAHALDVVIDAALILQQRAERVRFVLIGDGPEMNRIKARIAQHGLKNVDLTGLVPKRDVYSHLRGADALLVTGKNLPVYRYGVAFNKIPDYMLAARPLIFAVSAGNNPVAEAQAGIAVPGEDAGALADAVVSLAQLPAPERQRMGERAREFALQVFDYEQTARRMSERL
jgi:glycosyltransferase involved in cell wall biosynthesis